MARQSPSGLKTFRKGEKLFSAGEPARKLYLIQTGLVSVTAPKAGKEREIYQALAPQLVGLESNDKDSSLHSTTGVALNDASAIEIPVVLAQELIGKSPSLIKLLAQGMAGKHASISTELTTRKLEEIAEPCPPEAVTKLFATLFHVASYTATVKDGRSTVNWPAFRKYCQRVFLESPVRLEQAIYLLLKIKYLEIQMVKDEVDPEGPELLGFVHFLKLGNLKSFYEFYRKRYAELGSQALKLDYSKQRVEDVEHWGILKEIETWNQQGRVDGSPPPATIEPRPAPSSKKGKRR